MQLISTVKRKLMNSSQSSAAMAFFCSILVEDERRFHLSYLKWTNTIFVLYLSPPPHPPLFCYCYLNSWDMFGVCCSAAAGLQVGGRSTRPARGRGPPGPVHCGERRGELLVQLQETLQTALWKVREGVKITFADILPVIGLTILFWLNQLGIQFI